MQMKVNASWDNYELSNPIFRDFFSGILITMFEINKYIAFNYSQCNRLYNKNNFNFFKEAESLSQCIKK